jgi:hypothetical protein
MLAEGRRPLAYALPGQTSGSRRDGSPRARCLVQPSRWVLAVLVLVLAARSADETSVGQGDSPT